jgi:hypothetical protein
MAQLRWQFRLRADRIAFSVVVFGGFAAKNNHKGFLGRRSLPKPLAGGDFATVLDNLCFQKIMVKRTCYNARLYLQYSGIQEQ